jgi:5-methylcytosine-specific restriction endonuclease McrA
MPSKLCKDCLRPFDQFTSMQTRCGPCTYKHNMDLAFRSKQKAAKRTGSGYKWNHAKRQWIEDHPPTDDIWACHYCGKPLTINPDLMDLGVEFLTLDHVEPRGSNPHKKYLDENLVPCCLMDNSRKGSKSYESYCLEYYPHLI